MPSQYKETTYHEITRWTEDTEIKYAPTGKRAGTKSAARYAEYSVAKTVGEALRLGSKPEDLLNDFEKGLLTTTGGPKRESPVDVKSKDAAKGGDAGPVTTPTKAQREAPSSTGESEKATPVKREMVQRESNTGESEKATPVKRETAGQQQKLLAAFEALSRCTPTSKIQFKPDGKTKQSHANSYERYQKYAVAQTIGQAMDLGASGQDIQYDFQNDFITILGTDVPEGEVGSSAGRVSRFLAHCKRRYLSLRSGQETGSVDDSAEMPQKKAKKERQGQVESAAPKEERQVPASGASPKAAGPEPVACAAPSEKASAPPTDVTPRTVQQQQAGGIDAQEFFAKLAAEHGVPAAEYTEKHGLQEWRQILLRAAGRIYATGPLQG